MHHQRDLMNRQRGAGQPRVARDQPFGRRHADARANAKIARIVHRPCSTIKPPMIVATNTIASDARPQPAKGHGEEILPCVEVEAAFDGSHDVAAGIGQRHGGGRAPISVLRSAMPRRQCHPRVGTSAADPAPRDVAHQVTDIAL